MKGMETKSVSAMETGVSETEIANLLHKDAGVSNSFFGIKWKKSFSDYIRPDKFHEKAINKMEDGDIWAVVGYRSPVLDGKNAIDHTFVLHKKFDKLWTVDSQGKEIIFKSSDYPKYRRYRFLKAGKAKGG